MPSTAVKTSRRDGRAASRAMLPGCLAAFALAPAALLPAVAPVAGKPVPVVTAPWQSSSAVLENVLAADGRVIDASSTRIVAAGPPGFLDSLFSRGVFLLIRADDVSCSRN